MQFGCVVSFKSMLYKGRTTSSFKKVKYSNAHCPFLIKTECTSGRRREGETARKRNGNDKMVGRKRKEVCARIKYSLGVVDEGFMAVQYKNSYACCWPPPCINYYPLSSPHHPLYPRRSGCNSNCN